MLRLFCKTCQTANKCLSLSIWQMARDVSPQGQRIPDLDSPPHLIFVQHCRGVTCNQVADDHRMQKPCEMGQVAWPWTGVLSGHIWRLTYAQHIFEVGSNLIESAYQGFVPQGLNVPERICSCSCRACPTLAMDFRLSRATVS